MVLMTAMFHSGADKKRWDEHVYRVLKCPDCSNLMKREDGVKKCYRCGYSECG